MNTYTKTALILILGLASPVWAATYYIDYDSGLDSNAGTIDAPWKHCPGDSHAPVGSNPANRYIAGFSGGDKIYFKGGVRYPNRVTIASSGTAGNYISFIGDEWGAEKALMDGSIDITNTWTQCTSSSECYGNTAWQNIWYTDSAADFFVPRYQGDNYLQHAQYPNPARAVDYLSSSHYIAIDPDSVTHEVTRTSITDPDTFSQEDETYWDGAYVTILYGTNSKAVATITDFNPATDTVSFADIGGDLYELDGNYWYSVMNHPRIIDVDNEFAVFNNVTYLRTTTNPNTTPVRLNDHDLGFDIRGRDYLIFEGFEARCYYINGTNVGGIAFRLATSSHTFAEYVIIRDCEVYHCGNISSGIEGGGIDSRRSNYCTITNNTVRDCMQSGGIVMIGDYNTITHNIIDATSGQGIYIGGATQSIVAWNTVQNIEGSHSNGISAYSSSDNSLIAHNIVTECNHPITMEYSSDIYVFGNLVDGWLNDAEGVAISVEVRSTMNGRKNLIACNTIVRNGDQKGIGSISDGMSIFNNFIDGGGGSNTAPYRRNNIFLDWGAGQSALLTLQTGELDRTTVAESTLFANFGTDFSLCTGSDALNAGYDLETSITLLSALFPTYDFTIDLEGTPRPASYADWDIGAYEYPISGEGEETTPTATTRKIYFWQGGLYAWDE